MLEQQVGALRPTGDGLLEDLERLVGCDRVGQVAEVDEVDQLLRRHRRDQLPQRQPGPLGLEIPQGVDHGADGHVHDALLRSEPAQVRVVDEASVGGAHVGEQVLDGLADEHVGHCLDGLGRDVVAAAGGEHEAGPDQAVAGVGGQRQVGRRVVRVGVHRVRAVELLGGGEPDVNGVRCGDPGQGSPLVGDGMEHEGPDPDMSHESMPREPVGRRLRRSASSRSGRLAARPVTAVNHPMYVLVKG